MKRHDYCSINCFRCSPGGSSVACWSSFQVTRAQRQTDESLLELDQQRKETAKVQQASNDELDKVWPLGGAAAVMESTVFDK